MNTTKINNATLKSVCYKFSKPSKKDISISILDEIDVSECEEKNYSLNIVRTLDFGEKADSYIKIVFEVIIDCTEDYDLQTLKKKIEEGLPVLDIIYSKISLLISEISNFSPFGAIVTIPTYNKKDLIIK